MVHLPTSIRDTKPSRQRLRVSDWNWRDNLGHEFSLQLAPRAKGHRKSMAMKLGAFPLLSLATAVSVYILIVIGGLVATNGYGLACPDWPLCNGQVVPTFTTPVIIEYTHRVWTLLVTALVIATTVFAWKKYHWKSRVTKIATLTFILLLGQIILGMITVDTRTLPLVVTAHLALATLVFASVLTTSFLSLAQRG